MIFLNPTEDLATSDPEREWAIFVWQRDSLTFRKYTILRRDGFRCGYCGCDLLADYDLWRTATIDHIWPRCKGGKDRPSNLIACCSCCNQLKSPRMNCLDRG